MNDKCWFCLQEVEKDKWREHMDTVHRAVNREMPVENNSIPIEPLVMLKIADTVKDIMQEGFEIAMGGNIDLSEEANRREQSARYDRAVKNYTEIIARNFSA